MTPSRLVTGQRLQLIDVITQIEDVQNDNIDDYNIRLKYLKTIIDHYWKRFSREYIAQLRESHFYERKGQKIDNTEYLRVEEIVLINDDQLKRNLWKRGVVEKLIFF